MWCFFFSSRRRHTRCSRDWSSDVCSSDLVSFCTFQNMKVSAERQDPLQAGTEINVHQNLLVNIRGLGECGEFVCVINPPPPPNRSEYPHQATPPVVGVRTPPNCSILMRYRLRFY